MSETRDYNYDDLKAPVGDNLLASIRAVAVKQKREEAEVARLEAELKEAKQRLKHLAEHELPGLMDTAGMKEFALEDGTKVKVDEVLRGNIPATRRDEAHTWLEEHNSGNLIKRSFVIEFNKDEEAWAQKFARDLAQRKKPVRAAFERVVHPQTLLAYLREQLAEGTDIPLDLFGVYRQRQAKIEVPKEEKRRGKG